MSLDAEALRGSSNDGGFSARTMFVVILVGLVAFVGLGVLTAYAPELKSREQGGENALSRSAVGYAGLVRLLQAQGTPVVVCRGPIPPPRGSPGLLIFTPPPGASAAALIKAFNASGRPAIAILPKWAFTPDRRHTGWVRRIGLVAPPVVTSMIDPALLGGVIRRSGSAPNQLRGVGGLFSNLDPLPTGPVQTLQTLQAPTKPSPGAEVLLTDDQGRPVLMRVDRDLIVLSDPDLMDNHGLASLATARTALEIIDDLRGGQGPVVFDVTLNGLQRTPSLLGLALSPPFLGASLCALATGLLMGLHGVVRFGPARPATPAYGLGKAALLDNTAMLIRLARREPGMGRRYAAMVRRALARRVLSPSAAEQTVQSAVDRGAAFERLNQDLDRLTPKGEPPFTALVAEAQAARTGPAMMRAVGRLYQRRQEVLGGRG